MTLCPSGATADERVGAPSYSGSSRSPGSVPGIAGRCRASAPAPSGRGAPGATRCGASIERPRSASATRPPPRQVAGPRVGGPALRGGGVVVAWRGRGDCRPYPEHRHSGLQAEAHPRREPTRCFCGTPARRLVTAAAAPASDGWGGPAGGVALLAGLSRPPGSLRGSPPRCRASALPPSGRGAPARPGPIRCFRGISSRRLAPQRPALASGGCSRRAREVALRVRIVAAAAQRAGVAVRVPSIGAPALRSRRAPARRDAVLRWNGRARPRAGGLALRVAAAEHGARNRRPGCRPSALLPSGRGPPGATRCGAHLECPRSASPPRRPRPRRVVDGPASGWARAPRRGRPSACPESPAECRHRRSRLQARARPARRDAVLL